MPKELAEWAEKFFGTVEGATIQHRDGMLICTANTQQIEAALEASPVGRALIALDKAEKPCVECSRKATEDGPFSAGGGSYETENGHTVMRTLRDENGLCINCGTATTAKQVADMRRFLKSARREWSKKYGRTRSWS